MLSPVHNFRAPVVYQQSNLPPLVVILGPTAVGKTEISIRLAEQLAGEIVSADSRLFYRGMDIGTAKPTRKEQARVSHHLIDVAEPDQPWSLALFQQKASQAIMDIQAREKLPFLVGGTGQYIRAVIQGWQVPEVEPRPGLRAALEQWAEEIGSDGLHNRLRQLDEKAALAIDARNTRRTIRALEVILTSGRPFSEQRRSQPSPYRLLLLGLTRPRSELYARIDARIQAMLDSGLIEEVQALLEKGYTSELPTLSAIGYREIFEYLHGRISLDEATQHMRRATRTFVRRQANWFKPEDPQIQWFNVDQDTPDELVSTIHSFLAMPEDRQ